MYWKERREKKRGAEEGNGGGSKEDVLRRKMQIKRKTSLLGDCDYEVLGNEGIDKNKREKGERKTW